MYTAFNIHYIYLQNSKIEKKKGTSKKYIYNEMLNRKTFSSPEEITSNTELISSDMWKVLYKKYRHEFAKETKVKMKKKRRKRYNKLQEVNSDATGSYFDEIKAQSVFRIRFDKKRSKRKNLTIAHVIETMSSKSENRDEYNQFLRAYRTNLSQTKITNILRPESNFKNIFLPYNYLLTNTKTSFDIVHVTVNTSVYLKYLNTHFRADRSKCDGNQYCENHHFFDNFRRQFNLPNFIRIKRRSLANESLTAPTKNKSNIYIELYVDNWLNKAELSCVAVSSALPERPVISSVLLDIYCK